ncbi:putative thiosulfate sulfurtransferase, mitochondrial [Portunus trituberculatus]|uniref:Putative thiosulfate sulfurtransferase, mitochondrial n=1 Tax=Portunus trituberculatus TaxID=210409 RepID=A0A5B7D545_PORTR|nr:putative thiosulfate sulfurtransferase, mitochondrial [Portunus trituberculatus]
MVGVESVEDSSKKCAPVVKGLSPPAALPHSHLPSTVPEIEEAVGLSENAFMERYGFPKPLPEDKNVVLTCRSGRRIRVAWDLLEPYGYCDVRLYFGSYLEWKSRGGPLLPVPPPRRPFYGRGRRGRARERCGRCMGGRSSRMAAPVVVNATAKHTATVSPGKPFFFLFYCYLSLTPPAGDLRAGRGRGAALPTPPGLQHEGHGLGGGVHLFFMI